MTHSTFLSTDEVLSLSQNGTIKILDATYGQPPLGEAYIEGALVFDIDDVADPNAELPHTIPDAKTFAEKISAMGISNDDHIVIYDQGGISMAASRAWWLFKSFGHDNVSLMDGGLKKWVSESKPVTESPSLPDTATDYTAVFHAHLYSSVDDVAENIESQNAQLVDARAPQRFTGETPDQPRSGHIPNSYNLFFMSLFNPEDGTIREKDDIKTLCEQAGIDLTKPIISSCGSGVTACPLAAILFHHTGKEISIFDGSWTEWSRRTDLPIEIGPRP